MKRNEKLSRFPSPRISETKIGISFFIISVFIYSRNIVFDALIANSLFRANREMEIACESEYGDVAYQILHRPLRNTSGRGNTITTHLFLSRVARYMVQVGLPTLSCYIVLATSNLRIVGNFTQNLRWIE